MVGPKSAIATRKEINVPKKPFASWTRLVAMISIVICARIRPFDCIGTRLSLRVYLGKTMVVKSRSILPSSRPADPFTVQKP